MTETNGTISKEEYIYDSVIKDKLVQIKKIDTNEIIQEISYSSTNVFKPSSMIIDKQNRLLTWQGKRLLKIGNDIHYEYDAQGIRTKKITPNETTTFELEGSNIIRMNKVTSNENVILDFIYDAKSMLVGLNTNEGNYFYIRDITGNIIGLIDNRGEFVVQYSYDAWGNILDKEVFIDCIASRHNPFVYKGYYFDSETNLYYLKTRYYCSNIRKFISADSANQLVPQNFSGLNLYNYCANNPIIRKDYNGKNWFTDVWEWVKDRAEDVKNFFVDDVWNGGVVPAWNATSNFVTNTVPDFFVNTVWKNWIVDKTWNKFIVGTIWDKGILPAWNATSNFVTNTVPDFFVNTVWKNWIVDKTWNKFIVGTIWDKGLKPAGLWLWDAWKWASTNPIVNGIVTVGGFILAIVGCFVSAPAIAIIGAVVGGIGVLLWFRSLFE